MNAIDFMEMLFWLGKIVDSYTCHVLALINGRTNRRFGIDAQAIWLLRTVFAKKRTILFTSHLISLSIEGEKWKNATFTWEHSTRTIHPFLWFGNFRWSRWRLYSHHTNTNVEYEFWYKFVYLLLSTGFSTHGICFLLGICKVRPSILVFGSLERWTSYSRQLEATHPMEILQTWRY